MLYKLLLGISVGMVLPLQTVVNTRLNKAIHSVIIATTISCTLGSIFLMGSILITHQTIPMNLQLMSKHPWWIWTGGLWGIGYLIINILILPRLGSVQTVILPILGQIGTSLLIDQFGWFFANKYPLTANRVISVLFLLMGVILTTLSNQKNIENKKNYFWSTLGIVSGCLSAIQSTINGHLNSVLHSPLHTSLISFTGATLGLWCILLLHHTQTPLKIQKYYHLPLWVWSGGLIGILYVLGNSYLVPILGVGVTTIVVLSGMILAGILINQFHLTQKFQKITWYVILGILLMMNGIFFIEI